MSALGRVCESVDAHARFVTEQVRRARHDAAFRTELLERWKIICEKIGTVRTPTGIELPALALPQTESPAEIARYLFGIDYKPVDLRLAIVDASAGRISSATDALLLYCYHYEPTNGRYGLMIMRLVRTAGVATVLCIAGVVIFFLRRERQGQT